MKTTPKILSLFLIIYCNAATAQYTPAVTKTSFNKFVEDDDIEWAAYVDDSRNFQLLTHLLLQKQFTGKIKGFLPVEDGVPAEDHLAGRDTAELKQILWNGPPPVYDSIGILIPAPINPNATDVMGELKNSLVSFSQILYIKRGKLESYIPRVSVRKEIITPRGTYIGFTDIVSYCINKKYNNTARRKDKITFLGSSGKTIYIDSIPDYDRVKFLFGKNLVTSLAPYILSGELDIYGPEDNDRIMPDSLLAGNYPEADHISVPVYDSTGNLIGGRVLTTEFSFSIFKRADIIEEFYYDETKNIIICKIPQLILFKYAQDTDRGLVPSLRIVF